MARRLSRCWQLAVVGAALTAIAASAQETFDRLQASGVTFSNIVVMTKTGTHLTFKHSRGFATVKLKDLDDETLTALGYVVQPPPKPPLEKGLDLAKVVTADPRVQQAQQQVAVEIQRLLEQGGPYLPWILLGVGGFLYLFYCVCCMLICKKAGKEPGFLIWLPVLQTFPLLRAANMSGWNFLLLLLPVVNLIVGIVWCFKICQARDKSPLVAVLLILPVTNILAFLYLAFSDGYKVEEPQQRKIQLSFQSVHQGS